MVRVVRSSSNPALHDFLLSWGVGSVDAALFVRRVRGGRCRNLGSDHPGDILGSSMRVAGARRGAKGLAGSTVARLPARADSRRRRTHDQQRMHPAEDAYRRYRYRIYRFFLVRTGSHHDAEDLTQRVFVDALTALSSADTTPDSVLHWLYAVAQRRLVDEYRRRGRSIDDAIPMSRLEPTYGDDVSSSLATALATLTAEQRTVVVLRLLRGLSFPEIADLTGVSEDACKMRFSRALGAIRIALHEWAPS